MKGQVSESNKALFKPFFPLAVGAKTLRVTLDEFENNPGKYVDTGIGHMYENREQIREAKKANALKPVKLDMAKAKRGKAFQPNSLKDDVANMLQEQARRQARVRARFDKQNAADTSKATNKGAEKSTPKPPATPPAAK